MTGFWALACLMMAFVTCIHAKDCEDPEDWEPARVLAHADILISGKFVARYKDQSESEGTHTIILNTDVDCIIHRPNESYVIPSHINITEVRKGTYNDTEDPCVDYRVDDIEFNRDVVIMIEKRDSGWGFDTENEQGPWWYEDDVDMVKLMRDCDHIDPEYPEGGHISDCPIIQAQEHMCIDIDDDDHGSNNTSPIIHPLGGASMAGIMVLYRTLV